MDSSQHQEMPNSSMESMLGCSKAAQDRKPRPNPEQAQKCPRCDSTNTKFCYYNNYSLSQPRYFCKSCRRYWTKGGTLRNVPVGGGCRKNRRSSSIKRTQDPQNPNPNTNPMSGIPSLSCYDSSDHLSLAFARLQKGQQLGFHDHELSLLGNSIINTSNAGANHGFLGANHNFQNLYYGFGNGEVEDCGEGQNQMMHMFPYDHQNPEINSTTTTTTAATTATTVTTMKQEMISNIGRDHGVSDQNKVLWGFPWQMNGDGGESWNGFNSSWHGLINSPLM